MDKTPSAVNNSDDEVLHIDYQNWKTLAESLDRKKYCESWLAIACESVGNVAAATVLLIDDNALEPAAIWPAGDEKISSHMLELANDTLDQRKALIDRSTDTQSNDSVGLDEYVMSYPLVLDDGISAIVVVQVRNCDQIRLSVALRQLQLGSAWLELLFRREDSVKDQILVDQAISTLSLIAKVSAQSDATDAAMELVTILAINLRCEKVVYGEYINNQLNILALSNSGQFGKKMNLISMVSDAMLESIDQQKAISLPELEKTTGSVLIKHNQLKEEFRSTAIMTIPVQNEEKWLGAVLLERSSGAPFSRNEFDLVDTTVAIAGNLISDKQLIKRSIRRVIWDKFQGFTKNTIANKYPVRTTVFGGLAIVVLCGVFISGKFEVKATASLEGAIERSVVAPFNGYIELSEKRIGDHVSLGEVLGQMDSSELELELIELTSKKAQAKSQIRESQASGDRAKAKIFQTQIDQVEAQVALLQNNIARTSLVAPYDGYIVRGDLSRQLGAAINRGDVMFVIAPLNQYRVVIEVDERDISYVAPGSSTRLILSAIPTEIIELTVKEIMPVATAAEGRNYFRVEAEITDDLQQLRPGMEGIARIDGGRRKLFWIWTREFMDWVRISFWKWMP